jgi:lantibiotic modifying enzyme
MKTGPASHRGHLPNLLAWLATGLGVITLSACSAERTVDSRPYLDAAIETAGWLDGVSVERDGLRWWAEWVEAPDRVNPTIGSGVAGQIMFYLALGRATGDPRYDEVAASGARYVLDTLPAMLESAADMRSPGSLYGGLPSIALTLDQMFLSNGDSVYRAAALLTLERLHELARRVPDGVEWAPYNDLLFGSAGTGLFLIQAAEDWGHAPSLDLAIEIGETLLGRAVREPDGLTWSLRNDREIFLPNFSHGGAGVGYFLLRLAQATGDRRFLEAANLAAQYLEAIAKTDDGGFILPYSLPNGEFDYSWDIGWAHGPAGAARFFFALWRETGNDRWGEIVRQSVTALRNAGVPGTPMPEFGQAQFRNDLRFGQAGVAMLLLDLYQASGDSTYLEFGREVVDSVLARATADSNGRRWTVPQYGFMPKEGEPATFTGYFYGAAGYGLTLLRLDGALQDMRWDVVLPDNPFGRVRR